MLLLFVFVSFNAFCACAFVCVYVFYTDFLFVTIFYADSHWCV